MEKARELEVTSRIKFADHTCFWSESLFDGNWKQEYDDVAPHLFACELDRVTELPGVRATV